MAWVNRFAFLFLSFLERDRTCFREASAGDALGDDAGTATAT